ncbi:ABC transporter permease [Oerskovia gallyi]|nr:ABC transporter permease [Oerskovia gallyi]
MSTTAPETARATRPTPGRRAASTARSTRHSPAAALRDVSAMTGRELRRTLRSVDGLVTALMLPVLIMLVFVVVFGGAIEDDGSYVGYVVPGILVLCLGFGSATAALSVAQDMTSGTINRFKTLPIFGPSVLWAHVLASTVRNLVSATLVLLVAVALGFTPGADLGGWVGVAGYLALMVLAFTWLSCLAGLVLSVDAAASFNMFFLFVPYLSSGFVQVETMPTWLHGFAMHQPFTPIIETLRALLSGTSAAGSLVPAIAWLVGMFAVSCALASVLYRRRTAH